LLTLAWFAPLSAQGLPSPIAPPTREELAPPAAPLPTQRSRLQIDGGIERAPCPLADPAYADIRLTISKATFNNLKGVSPEELSRSYASMLGADKPVSTICDIRDAAATLLRRKGYLAAIQVPVQKIEGGDVRFEVLYAKIVAVRVRGDAGPNEKLVARYLNKLTQDEVFNSFAAERYLLLARDLPGYDVKLSLRPAGKALGELYGDVTVVRRPIDADVNVQNLAASSTGRWGGQIRAQINGALGLGDRTSIGFYSTSDFSEQQILQLGEEIRVGGEGLTLAGHFTYAWTKPDVGFANVDVKARTLFANVEASYPFVRSQLANLRGSAGVDLVNQRVTFNTIPLTHDRLRVAYLRLEGDLADPHAGQLPRWRHAYSIELRQGLNIFDPTEGFIPGGVSPSRADGDAEGTLMRLSGLSEFRVVRNLTVSVAPRAQYSWDPLLSFEEYSAGNFTIGRGYDPGTLIGDSGVGATAEVRIDRLTPFKDKPLALQPFLFVDSAWVWNKDTGGDSSRLTSVGGGVRTSYADRVRLDVTLAVPVKRAGLQTRRGDTRFLVSLTTRLWPWGAQ
jgi:hemolysin activation/secretion protein